jgi:hypothetical protein
VIACLLFLVVLAAVVGALGCAAYRVALQSSDCPADLHGPWFPVHGADQ